MYNMYQDKITIPTGFPLMLKLHLHVFSLLLLRWALHIALCNRSFTKSIADDFFHCSGNGLSNQWDLNKWWLLIHIPWSSSSRKCATQWDFWGNVTCNLYQVYCCSIFAGSHSFSACLWLGWWLIIHCNMMKTNHHYLFLRTSHVHFQGILPAHDPTGIVHLQGWH